MFEKHPGIFAGSADDDCARPGIWQQRKRLSSTDKCRGWCGRDGARGWRTGITVFAALPAGSGNRQSLQWFGGSCQASYPSSKNTGKRRHSSENGVGPSRGAAESALGLPASAITNERVTKSRGIGGSMRGFIAAWVKQYFNSEWVYNGLLNEHLTNCQ